VLPPGMLKNPDSKVSKIVKTRELVKVECFWHQHKTRCCLSHRFPKSWGNPIHHPFMDIGWYRWDFHGFSVKYPLVNCPITMENHHF
jgi:hypothetical protein